LAEKHPCTKITQRNPAKGEVVFLWYGAEYQERNLKTQGGTLNVRLKAGKNTRTWEGRATSRRDRWSGRTKLELLKESFKKRIGVAEEKGEADVQKCEHSTGYVRGALWKKSGPRRQKGKLFKLPGKERTLGGRLGKPMVESTKGAPISKKTLPARFPKHQGDSLPSRTNRVRHLGRLLEVVTLGLSAYNACSCWG